MDRLDRVSDPVCFICYEQKSLSIGIYHSHFIVKGAVNA